MWKSTIRLGMNIKNSIKPLADKIPIMIFKFSSIVGSERVINRGVSVETALLASRDGVRLGLNSGSEAGVGVNSGVGVDVGENGAGSGDGDISGLGLGSNEGVGGVGIGYGPGQALPPPWLGNSSST